MRDPFTIDRPTCISFSGGRTSAYMLWRVLDANGGLTAQTVVCFANTGKEVEATLRFVRDCASHWRVPIHWRRSRFRHGQPCRRAFRGADPQAPVPAEPGGEGMHHLPEDQADAQVCAGARLDGMGPVHRHPRGRTPARGEDQGARPFHRIGARNHVHAAGRQRRDRAPRDRVLAGPALRPGVADCQRPHSGRQLRSLLPETPRTAPRAHQGTARGCRLVDR